MNQISERHVKVLFRVDSEDGSADVETLWAIDLGSDRYEFDNLPFYAYSVSWKDIVYAPFDTDEGALTFQRVVTKSGNRTLCVLFDVPFESGNMTDQVLKGLVALGCSYESATKKFFSVNVPPPVDLDAVRDYLVTCDATWEHADPSDSELYPDHS